MLAFPFASESGLELAHLAPLSKPLLFTQQSAHRKISSLSIPRSFFMLPMLATLEAAKSS
jgi:hypothetical protein